jgi:hypothetical protein
MLHTVLALAERIHPTSDRRHALAHVQGEPFDKGGMHLPAMGHQDVLDRFTRPAYHPVCDSDHAFTTGLLDDLGVEQPKERPPARLGQRAFVLAAFWVHSPATVAEDGRQIPLEAITQPRWHTT